MSLRDLAKLAELGVDAVRAYEGNERSSERFVRRGLPFIADRMAPGAGRLCQIGLDLLERRGLLQPDAIEGEYRVVDDPAGCGGACAEHYKASGERRVAAYLDDLSSGIVYILGRRGTGKTALSFRLAERWARPTFALGVPQRSLPESWQEIEDVKGLATLPMRSTLIVDDAGIMLDSQASGNALNRAMKHLVMIVRHREIKLVINTQYASAVNKYVLDAEAIFLKPPPRMYQVIERDELKALHEQLGPFWSGLGAEAEKLHSWVITDMYSGPIHSQLPAFWTEAVSMNKGGAG